jgi:hypothetical protein
MDAGAEIGLLDHYGQDALSIAFHHGHTDVVDLLKQWARDHLNFAVLKRQEDRERTTAIQSLTVAPGHANPSARYEAPRAPTASFTLSPNVEEVRTVLARGLSQSEAARILREASGSGRKDIVDLLLDQARPLLELGDLTLAAEAAVKSGNGIIGRHLVDAGAAEPWWWRRRLFSEKAEFLGFSRVLESEAEQLTAALRELSPDTLVGNLDSWRLRRAPLGFLPGHSLLAIECCDSVGQNEQFLIIQHNGAFVTLNWANEPIYSLLEKTTPDFSRKNLLTYISFFLHMVRGGSLGNFQIVERVDQILWTAEAPAEIRDRAMALITPLTLARRYRDYAIARGTIVFKNALFRTSLRVALKAGVMFPKIGDDERGEACLGKIRLERGESLLEDMPIEIDGARGVFG